MTWQVIRISVAGGVLAVVVAGGCSQSPSRVAVSGTVTVDGKPLETGSLVVAPERGRAARAQIGLGGRFSLSTWQMGDGVVPGIHRVEVRASERVDSTRVRWLVPRAVRDLSTTPLRLDASVSTELAVIAIETHGQPLDAETDAQPLDTDTP